MSEKNLQWDETLQSKLKYFTNFKTNGAMGRSVRSLSGRLVVRIQSVTDLSRKTGSDSSSAKRSALGVSVTGPRK